MPEHTFRFKQFDIYQKNVAMKITTESCIFGSWVGEKVSSLDVSNALDIGTGTGLLTLMLAQKLKNTHFDAVEIDKLAYKEASFNFLNSKWSERINIHYSSIQNFTTEIAYDFIICNPPFFSNHKKSVKPEKNLAIHNDSLPIETLVETIEKFSHSKTVIFILYPTQEMNEFSSLMKTNAFYPFTTLSVYNKPNNESSFRKIIGFSKKDIKKPLHERLNIRNEEGKYSDSLQKLVEDYYL